MTASLLLAGILENLGINLKVLGTQVVIFVITFLVLSRLLFGRVLEFMKKREEEIKHSHEVIERDRREVEGLMRQYQTHMAKTDREAYEKMQAIFKEALAASASIIAQAQTEAGREVEAARAEISREKEAAVIQLRGEVDLLARTAVDKILEMPAGRS